MACISYKLYISGSELQSIPAHEWEMIVTLTTSITGLKHTTTLPLCCACATIGAYGWLYNFALGLIQMYLILKSDPPVLNFFWGLNVNKEDRPHQTRPNMQDICNNSFCLTRLTAPQSCLHGVLTFVFSRSVTIGHFIFGR